MMVAARAGHKEILSLLIERGGNIDLQDKVRLYHTPPHEMGVLVLDTIPMLYHVVSYLYCIPLPPPSLLHLLTPVIMTEDQPLIIWKK